MFLFGCPPKPTKKGYLDPQTACEQGNSHHCFGSITYFQGISRFQVPLKTHPNRCPCVVSLTPTPQSLGRSQWTPIWSLSLRPRKCWSSEVVREFRATPFPVDPSCFFRGVKKTSADAAFDHRTPHKKELGWRNLDNCGAFVWEGPVFGYPCNKPKGATCLRGGAEHFWGSWSLNLPVKMRRMAAQNDAARA